jgi:translation initiation factor 5
MIPIRGLIEIKDPFYRYKMAKIDYIIGKTKIHLMNLDEIYVNIGIHDNKLFPKFLEKRLSTNIVKSKYKISLSNKINIKDINNCLYEFIEYFVICPECRLPETNFLINNKKLYLSCKACGAENKIVKTDYTKKIIKIIKNNK